MQKNRPALRCTGEEQRNYTIRCRHDLELARLCKGCTSHSCCGVFFAGNSPHRTSTLFRSPVFMFPNFLFFALCFFFGSRCLCLGQPCAESVIRHKLYGPLAGSTYHGSVLNADSSLLWGVLALLNVAALLFVRGQGTFATRVCVSFAVLSSCGCLQNMNFNPQSLPETPPSYPPRLKFAPRASGIECVLNDTRYPGTLYTTRLDCDA